ncbi:MAG: polyprenol monophosphomannose synthase [Demequina sp.]
MVARVVVIIPTYNERDSLPVQVAAVREHAPEVDILVVDDNSPDGTGQWASQQANRDPHLHVLHRPGKEGLGAAYLEGFAWALERDYTVVVEMDADGSHQAHQLRDVVDGTQSHDLSIGSRWVSGGAVRNWPRHRRWLSKGANTYVRFALGLPVRDATAGFRAYRSTALRGLSLEAVESQGYCFQIDMCWRVWRAGATVTEVPIEFVEREQGTSKMSGAIIREALIKVTAWGISRRWRQLTRRGTARTT